MNIGIFLKRLIPLPLKRLCRSAFPLQAIEHTKLISQQANPYADESTYGQYKGDGPFKFGIIKEFTHFHKHFIAACREMNVSYEVIDISGPDWINTINQSKCDAFLVWPSVYFGAWKQMYDERLKVISESLSKIIFPSHNELWMWESKRRMSYWLEANNIPHPKTYIFYDHLKAIEFINHAKLPIVYKPDFGDCAKGIQVIRTRTQGINIIKNTFKRGYCLPGMPKLDIQWGSILFQEYIPHDHEWRMVRIGDSFFGYQKTRIGDFASGSHHYRHQRPPDTLLDFFKNLTDTANFKSMDADIFTSSDNSYLVNELQAVFGANHPKEQLVIDGEPGRLLWNKTTNQWKFEKGCFCEHQLCGLRIQYLIDMLSNK